MVVMGNRYDRGVEREYGAPVGSWVAGLVKGDESDREIESGEAHVPRS
jgi:hypothetical protein